NAFEIFDRFLLGLSKNSGADEIEDHAADIFARADAPAVEHGDDQRCEFLQSIVADAFEQFRSGNMPYRCPLYFLLLFGGEIEGVPQKDVGLALITRVAGHNRIESFGKSNLLHESVGAMIISKTRASNCAPASSDYGVAVQDRHPLANIPTPSRR